MTPGWVIPKQVPPFWQGFGEQEFNIVVCSQKDPVKFGRQKQTKLFWDETQVPEFWQGRKTQVFDKIEGVVVVEVATVVEFRRISHLTPVNPALHKQFKNGFSPGDWMQIPLKQGFGKHKFGTIGVLHWFEIFDFLKI